VSGIVKLSNVLFGESVQFVVGCRSTTVNLIENFQTLLMGELAAHAEEGFGCLPSTRRIFFSRVSVWTVDDGHERNA